MFWCEQLFRLFIPPTRKNESNCFFSFFSSPCSSFRWFSLTDGSGDIRCVLYQQVLTKSLSLPQSALVMVSKTRRPLKWKYTITPIILDSDLSILIRWLGYWPLIGRDRSRDLNTPLRLVNAGYNHGKFLWPRLYAGPVNTRENSSARRMSTDG